MNEKKSFAEIVSEVEAESGDQPAWVETGGEALCDPEGHRLESRGKLRPAQARQLVLDGARLAWDGCGCEDYPPVWIATDAARAAAESGKPRLEHGNACDTYIDHWRDDCGDVVCLHGDVAWGLRLPE